MRWADFEPYRAERAGGVFLAITRKCPLHCAHCSTSSDMASEQGDAAQYRAFAGSFSPSSHPKVVWFTGGEPLLRASLLSELAQLSHRVGAITAITTSMYFARRNEMPKSISKALDYIDFTTVSIDRWHEMDVQRSDVFNQIDRLLEKGRSVGIQTTADGEDDVYVRRLIDDVERRFGHDVGICVDLLKPAGRGANLTQRLSGDAPTGATGHPIPQGCGGLSWPVFGFSGPMLNACCNQEAIDARAKHLSLPPDWAALVATLNTDPVLRVINALGPRIVAFEIEPNSAFRQDYCSTCLGLANESNREDAALSVMGRPSWKIAERLVDEMRRTHGDPTLAHGQYQDLLEWGN